MEQLKKKRAILRHLLEPRESSLLERLDSNVSAVRIEAERQLAALGPAGLDALIALMAQDQRQNRRYLFRIFIVIAVMFAVSTAHTIIPGVPKWLHLTMGSYIQVGIYGLIALFGVNYYQVRALHTLKRYDDVRAIGAFADGLRFKSYRIRQAVMEELTNLLPRLRASDASLLNPAQRSRLNKLLTSYWTEPTLIKAILLAWEQVGDQDALPYVQRLADGNTRSSEVRKAAEECLPYLTQRVAELNAASTLLRAADNAAIRPDVLLRAAAGSGSPHSDELLRADIPPDHAPAIIQNAPEDETVRLNVEES
jgi:hypothetical protein